MHHVKSLHGRKPLISVQLVEQFVLPQYPGNETAESRKRINALRLSQIRTRINEQIYGLHSIRSH